MRSETMHRLQQDCGARQNAATRACNGAEACSKCVDDCGTCPASRGNRVRDVGEAASRARRTGTDLKSPAATVPAPSEDCNRVR